MRFVRAVVDIVVFKAEVERHYGSLWAKSLYHTILAAMQAVADMRFSSFLCRTQAPDVQRLAHEATIVILWPSADSILVKYCESRRGNDTHQISLQY